MSLFTKKIISHPLSTAYKNWKKLLSHKFFHCLFAFVFIFPIDIDFARSIVKLRHQYRVHINESQEKITIFEISNRVNLCWFLPGEPFSNEMEKLWVLKSWFCKAITTQHNLYDTRQIEIHCTRWNNNNNNRFTPNQQTYSASCCTGS